MRHESGFTIVENLVAMFIISAAVIGSTGVVVNSMHGNSAARTYTSLVSDVQAKIDDYRKLTFSDLLGKFNTTKTNITNGQVATESSTSSSARASYVTTFTAQRADSTSAPQAVLVHIQATQRRGKFGTATYSFETLITNVD